MPQQTKCQCDCNGCINTATSDYIKKTKKGDMAIPVCQECYDGLIMEED